MLVERPTQQSLPPFRPPTAGGNSVQAMSALSAPASSGQTTVTGYNFCPPSAWNQDHKSEYISNTIEFREPNGFAANEFLGAWADASLWVTKHLATVLGDTNLTMALQNNDWRTAENVIRGAQLTAQKAADKKFLSGPMVTSAQEISKLFNVQKMKDSCFVPLKTPGKPGWVRENGASRTLVLFGDSTLNMVGKKAKQSAQHKWAECIKNMYGCKSVVLILGGEGMVEMVRALQKYIDDNYGGDCSACHDIFV
eukprot:5315851-Karenia_brevis.AAC.1